MSRARKHSEGAELTALATVDSKGRILIADQLRRRLSLREGTELKLSLIREGDKWLISVVLEGGRLN